jgi:ABC-2 type transport system permease protein
MRLRDTFTRTLHDQLRPVVLWSIGAALLVSFYMALYPSIGSMNEMQQMIEQMPPAFRALFAAEGLDLSTPEGYLNIELFSFVGPLLVLAYTVSAGSGATAAEEERGTIDLLLSTPVTRRRVVLEKAAALGTLTLVLGGGMWLGVALGAAVGGVSVDLVRVAGALLSMLLMGAGFGAIAMLLGALTGRRTVSLAITAVLIIAGYMVNALGTIVDWLEPLRPVSPFFHFQGSDPLTRGLQAGPSAVLLAIIAIGVAGAVLAFDRRELRG